MELTDCQNQAFEPDSNSRRIAAQEYHQLKALGTVGDLCAKFGITRPTLLKWAEEFPPEGESNGAANSTGDPVAPPSHEDVSEEAAPSVADTPGQVAESA